MTTTRWDPRQYLEYADERLRPFLELVGRITTTDVQHVVDLGAGPGNATALLLERWPDANIVGIDNSEEMVERSKSLEVPGRLEFRLGDARKFSARRELDVLISNATLQWVPGHLGLFATWVHSLRPGGSFAFQVPSMSSLPSHRLLYELASEPQYKSRLERHIRSYVIETPERYLATLVALGCDVDVWETTYFQTLLGDDAVLEWTKGSVLRPFLTALEDDREREEFLERYRVLLAGAYPEGPLGTIYPFRRLFVVARTAG